jgi:hypothetical protein
MTPLHWWLHLYEQVGWADATWITEVGCRTLEDVGALEEWAARVRGWRQVRGKWRRVRYFWTFALVLLCVSVVQAGDAAYTLEDTSPFFGAAINATGRLAGQDCDETDCYPALWRGPGDVVRLSPHPGAAWALNDHDEVLFEGLDDEGEPSAWFWSRRTGVIRLSLGDTGYEQVRVGRLNNRRQLVGVLQFFHASGACPTRWASPTAAPQCLEPGTNASCEALNAPGTAACAVQSTLSGEDLAFRHHPTRGVSPIPFGTPVAITPTNVVLYDTTHRLLADNTLLDPIAVPGCGESTGVDLNPAGWMLGSSPCGSTRRAWGLKDGRVHGWRLTPVAGRLGGSGLRLSGRLGDGCRGSRRDVGAGPHQRDGPAEAGPTRQQREHADGHALVVLASARDDPGQEVRGREEGQRAQTNECIHGWLLCGPGGTPQGWGLAW